MQNLWIAAWSKCPHHDIFCLSIGQWSETSDFLQENNAITNPVSMKCRGLGPFQTWSISRLLVSCTSSTFDILCLLPGSEQAQGFSFLPLWLYSISWTKRSLSCSWGQVWIFIVIFSERRNINMQIYIPSWLEWALLSLPVCSKNSFCIFEILHVKQSVMICLSLAVSFFTGCGSLSFCRFASSFFPGKWSMLHLWRIFYSNCCILNVTNTCNLLFVCVAKVYYNYL